MTSRLAASASPYLRAHADNPVAWFPWSAEAFAEAARRDVPVLVSIGYSTCHWCHVMARESFQDPETAAELNDGFVAIKVDREEHPEVDAAYMAAASAFTQGLGWPLTVFTTPDGHAFYAGTYFPPAPRGGMPSFRQVLGAVRDAWKHRRDEVRQTAAAVVQALTKARNAAAGADDTPTRAQLEAAADRVLRVEDTEYGGFGAAGAPMHTPKFPTVPVLRFLQSPLLAAGAPQAAAGAARALTAMADSPLHDAVDGGFFRYATRRDWTVPHYERMLTDNAGLLDVALDARNEPTARDIARFLLDVLQQPSGGFAAAQDSESWIDGERSEGGYYARDADGRVALEPPAIDGKIVTGWNGMAIGALARAGVRLGASEYIAAARWAADAVLETAVAPDGTLRRATLDETVSPAAATEEDYGLLATGLLRLAEATGEVAYAERARSLVDECLPRSRASTGMDAPTFSSGPADPVLAARGVPGDPAPADTDHPSGPSALAEAACTLWQLGAGERYRSAAASVIAAHSTRALSEPLAHGALLRVAAQLAGAVRQVVALGTVDAPVVRAACALDADVVAVATAQQAEAFAAAGFALFEGKSAAVPTVYDCRDFACRLPVTDPAALTE